MKKYLFFTALLVIMPLANGIAQEFGLQLYSLRNQFETDVEGSLAQIKSWGITYIEGGGTYGYSQPEFLALLEKYGLKTASIGASFEELEKDPAALIDKAKAFGATYVMCAWIPHDGDNFDLSDTQKAIEVFNKAGKVLSDAGLTLAYHAHGYEFRPHGEGTLFDLMAQEARNYTFEMDVYWVFHGGGNPLELLDQYPGKFTLMHLKDLEHGITGNNTGHEDVETNVVLGTGQIDIAAIVKKGAAQGIKYMFIEDESSSVVGQVPESLKFLRAL